jgi:hypothetical protein
MDNQDKSNIQKIQNREYFQQLKESPYQIARQNKDYNYLYQPSPYISNIGNNYTPSKKLNLNNGFYPSLTETPLNFNINSPFSPMFNNHKNENSYQKIPYKRQSFSEYSPFKPLITSPNNNQRLSEKK